MNNSIICKSPTRVDLAGGTLDMWPLYSFVGSATTINVAIDIWTSAEFKLRTDSKLIFRSPDLKKEWEFAELTEFLTSQDPSISFYQIIFSHFKDELLKLNSGFELTTTSQSPIGGGLGGSSSMTISILKAIYQLLKLPLPQVHDIVYLAHNIEAEMLRTPTGTQDYYPAVTGGLSYIEYSASRVEQKILSLDNTPFADHFLLVYTGRSHHSGLNNFEVLKAAVNGDAQVISALKTIKSISDELREAIENKAWSLIPDIFRREYHARIQLTPAFTSPEIEKLSEICLAAGALAVKICGAGGGGCVLVWVSPENRERVVSACQKEKFQCLNAKPVGPLN